MAAVASVATALGGGGIAAAAPAGAAPLPALAAAPLAVLAAAPLPALAAAPLPALARAPTTPPASTTTTPASTTTTPPPSAPPVDETTLRADQVAVVTADYSPAVQAAQRRLQGDQATLATRQATLAADRGQQQTYTARAAAAATSLAADTARHAQAVAAHTAATAALATDRRRLQGVAMVLYEGVPQATAPVVPAGTPPGPAVAVGQLSAQQETGYAEVLVQAAVASIDGDVGRDVHREAVTGAQAQHLATVVASDTAALSLDRTGAAASAGAVLADDKALASDAQHVQSDEASLAAAQAALEKAVAALAGTELHPPAPGDRSPSILGPSALDAAQLAAWFDASGYVDLTPASVQSLAQWYIAEGNAEGVRGDIAFAQAVLETGGFSSPDAVDLNNYAGIGHCDSCAAGWAFPSPQMGVRGQIQLLRAYAQPGLTTAELAAPPAIAGVTPEKQGVRGCCVTWQSLTGVWATDPIYGPVILNIYQQMLDSALKTPSLAAPIP